MFAHVVNLAREMGVVKVGTVSVDGTHIKANASKHKSVRYDRAGRGYFVVKRDGGDPGPADRTPLAMTWSIALTWAVMTAIVVKASQ